MNRFFSSKCLKSSTFFKKFSIHSNFDRKTLFFLGKAKIFTTIKRFGFSSFEKTVENNENERILNEFIEKKHRYFYVNEGFNNWFVSLWLYGAAALVLCMIAIGGYTRLTRSGLSMTKWKIVGYKYPKTQKDWEKEFALYQQFPEFKANPEMSMNEFKKIFTVEFVHRLAGNMIGGYFGFPMFYFWKRGYFTRSMKIRATILLALGGMQGLIGWWMVKSGLEKKPDYQSRPRVSTYRLIVHNTMAVGLYISLLTLAIKVGNPVRILPLLYDTSGIQLMKRFAMILVHCIGFNILSGVAVAGIDAGKVYNTWPTMNGEVIPSGYWRSELGIRNLFENLTTVQMNHRMLAYLTLIVTYIGSYKSFSKKMPLNIRMTCFGIFCLVNYQALLGIIMLLEQVPVKKGVEHQFNGILTLTLAVYLLTITKGKFIFK